MRFFAKVLGLGIVCAAALAAAAAQAPKSQPPAQPGKQPDAQPGKQGDDKFAPRFDAARFLKDHDKNNDGKLSQDELPAAGQKEFDKLDTNKDKFVSQDELQQHAERMSRQRPVLVEIFYYAVDLPDDQVTVEELQTAYEMLRKIDRNNDGKFDDGELKSFREQRKKERIDGIFTALDRNKDGKIGKDEARSMWIDNFGQLDTNKDGMLDRQEVEAACDMKGGQPGK